MLIGSFCLLGRTRIPSSLFPAVPSAVPEVREDAGVYGYDDGTEDGEEDDASEVTNWDVDAAPASSWSPPSDLAELFWELAGLFFLRLG